MACVAATIAVGGIGPAVAGAELSDRMTDSGELSDRMTDSRTAEGLTAGLLLSDKH